MIIRGMRWNSQQVEGTTEPTITVEVAFTKEDGTEKYLVMSSAAGYYGIIVDSASCIDRIYESVHLNAAEKEEFETFITSREVFYKFFDDEVPGEILQSEYLDIMNFACLAIHAYGKAKQEDFMKLYTNISTKDIPVCADNYYFHEEGYITMED